MNHGQVERFFHCKAPPLRILSLKIFSYNGNQLFNFKYMKKIKDYKEYYKTYQRKYYRKNKKKLDEKVLEFKRKEIENLADNYIVNVLTKYGKYKKDEVTPDLIKTKRREIKKRRKQRSIGK